MLSAFCLGHNDLTHLALGRYGWMGCDLELIILELVSRKNSLSIMNPTRPHLDWSTLIQVMACDHCHQCWVSVFHFDLVALLPRSSCHCINSLWPGLWFNLKVSLLSLGNPVAYMRVKSFSCRTSYTGKTASLYWISHLILPFRIRNIGKHCFRQWFADCSYTSVTVDDLVFSLCVMQMQVDRKEPLGSSGTTEEDGDTSEEREPPDK